ncbi:hypothetical protein HFP43_11940 [Streptomyces sp. SJ1-7]|nr:hypothetical protein [Streptomyces sp. SJ1-7]
MQEESVRDGARRRGEEAVKDFTVVGRRARGGGEVIAGGWVVRVVVWVIGGDGRTPSRVPKQSVVWSAPVRLQIGPGEKRFRP